jgi:small subunit ribosomal protein S16
MVVIRLARGGAKKRPFYHIVAADKRRARNSKYLERLGYFNPLAKGDEKELLVVRERVAHWVTMGAQLSDKVAILIKQWDKTAGAAA